MTVMSSWGCQSIKIEIRKPLDKSISINKLKLTVIDVINQSIKLDTDMPTKVRSYRFCPFPRIYRLSFFVSLSIRNSSTKAQLVEKVKQARARQPEANENRCQYSTLSTRTSSNWSFNYQTYDNKRHV
jgi:hypothetical protein